MKNHNTRPITNRKGKPLFIFSFLAAFLATPVFSQTAETANSMDVLLVTGGCCHDYDFQSKALQLAAKERKVDINWTVVNEGGTGNEAEISLYDRPNWSEGFDVVIHNECFAKTKSPEYIRKITSAHAAGTNAVVIHCAMHTYRDATIDDWREFLGVTSRRHDHQSQYPIRVVNRDHPIMKDFPDNYVSPKDELYIIEKLWPSATSLAVSTSEKSKDDHPVFWVNNYGKARVFGTTFGHSKETFSDPTFLNTVINGIVWAASK